MATEVWVNIGSGNGLLSDGTKPLLEPMLTDHRWNPVTFILGQFHKRCLNHRALKSIWKLHLKFHSNFPGVNELSYWCHKYFDVSVFSAAVTGNRDVAHTVVRGGANINAKDKDGKTALMIAVVNGHQSLVELLLERDADLTVKNEVSGTVQYSVVPLLYGQCTAFTKILGHVGHFRWLGPNVWWEILQIWIKYIKPIKQMSDEPWKFFRYIVNVVLNYYLQ